MRVLLVDDHALLVEGLQNLLEAHGIEVVGVARDGLEARAQANALKPEIILMDIRMPRCDGLTATRLIKADMPDTKIVILTTSTEDEDLFEAVKSGANGYLLKSMDAEGLVEALRDAQEDVPPFAPGLAAKLLAEFARGTGAEPARPATSRWGSRRARDRVGGDDVRACTLARGAAQRPPARGARAGRRGSVVQRGRRPRLPEPAHRQVPHGRDHAEAAPEEPRPGARRRQGRDRRRVGRPQLGPGSPRAPAPRRSSSRS